MRVSIVVASCYRPRLLDGMLDSLVKSLGLTKKFDIELVLVIDDDILSFDIACHCPAYDGQIIDYSPKRRGALAAWNRGLQISTGDIIVPAGDDQKFYDNWLEYALESHQERLGGCGVVGMNDLAYDGNTQVSTMFLFDRTYCKEAMGGIFAPPAYDYLCVDLEWNEKAKMLGKFYWDERSKVEHLHSAHGKRPFDEHDAKKDTAMYEKDTKTFEERKAQGFPVTWESLI